MDTSGVFSGQNRFNITEILKQPATILRIVSVVLSIIVFGCVSAGGHTHTGVCIFGGVQSACSYVVGIGVIAFLAAIGFLIGDALFNTISNLNTRRNIVLGDLVFSGLWTFLWFVGFCFLANKWTSTAGEWLDKHQVKSWQENNVRSAIAFSLFSAAVWGGITFFALRRFHLGKAGVGAEGLVSGGGEVATAGAPAPTPVYSTMPDSPPTVPGGGYNVGGGGNGQFQYPQGSY